MKTHRDTYIIAGNILCMFYSCAVVLFYSYDITFFLFGIERELPWFLRDTAMCLHLVAFSTVGFIEDIAIRMKMLKITFIDAINIFLQLIIFNLDYAPVSLTASALILIYSYSILLKSLHAKNN